MTVTSNGLKNVGATYRVEKETVQPFGRALKRIRQITVLLLAVLFTLFAATQVYFYSGSKEYNYERFNANSSRIEYGALTAGQPMSDLSLIHI